VQNLAMPLLRHGDDDFIDVILGDQIRQVFRLAQHGEAEQLATRLLAVDEAHQVIPQCWRPGDALQDHARRVTRADDEDAILADAAVL